VPLTFPSHPVAAMPIKLWRPGWSDGVALVLGSMAPDFAYVLDGSGLPVWPFSHQLWGLFGWCLPVALAGTWAVRRAAPVIAVHLPSGGRLALRDYGSIGASRHRWWTAAGSAVVGAASHLALDRLEVGIPATEMPMHLLGVAGMVLLALHIGRRRLLRRWHGNPPPRRPRPALFWPLAAAVTVPAMAVTLRYHEAFPAHTTGTRLLCAAAAGPLLAAAAVALRERAEASGSKKACRSFARRRKLCGRLGRWPTIHNRQTVSGR
jgi:hypothetical protein